MRIEKKKRGGVLGMGLLTVRVGKRGRRKEEGREGEQEEDEEGHGWRVFGQ